MLIIRRKEEMEKYYIKEVNTYVFKDNVEFLFDVEVDSHIDAYDIYAKNIKACEVDANDINALNINAFRIRAHNIGSNNIEVWGINANDITAEDISASFIKANNINYCAVCYAYYNIECNSIKGKYSNSKHFVLNGKLVVKGGK